MTKIILILLVMIYTNYVLSVSVKNHLQNFNNNIIERNIEILQENSTIIAKVENEGVSQTLRYTLGHRVLADNLIGRGNNTYRYSYLQNIKLTLTYPVPGMIGKTVTYCEVLVDQSSNQGRAYVISGGIGKKNIQIILEADSTIFLSYNILIYGY